LVVAAVVPILHTFLAHTGIPYQDLPDGGLVLVRRGIAPFEGAWCLPCGHVEKHGHPKDEAAKEVREESGLITRMEKLLCLCNPAPGEANHVVGSYLARPVGGALQAGDDATEVGVFTKENAPTLCFRSHERLKQQWFRGELGTLTGIDLML